MKREDPTNQTELKTKLLGQIYAVGFLMVLAWVPFIAVTVFHHDLLASDPQPGDAKIQAYLWLALVIDIAGPIFMWRIYSRIKVLASTGVRAVATLVKISAASNHGVRPATFSFAVGPITYTVKRDTPEIFLKTIAKTRQVGVIYDPANPNSCELIFPRQDEVAQEASAEAALTVWQKIVSVPMPKPVLVLIAVGALLLAALAIKGIGADLSAYGATIIVLGLLAPVCVDLGWLFLGDQILGRPDALFLRTRLWHWIFLGVLVVALPATIIWTRHDQSAAIEAQRKHDEEDLQNAQMMKNAALPSLAPANQGAQP